VTSPPRPYAPAAPRACDPFGGTDPDGSLVARMGAIEQAKAIG
jgi:hypothetical protein